MSTDVRPVADYPALLRLDGRGYVILGSGYGIGRETARAITQAGGRVICVDRDEEIVRTVAGEVGGEPIVADLTRVEEVQAIFARADALFGQDFAGFVDVAGLAIIKELDELDDDTWTLQLDQTFRHAHLALRAAAPYLRANGGGAITFVGSLAGILTFRKQMAYGAAKAALHHLARTAAYDLARDGIRVNAVAPGFVKTPALLARLSGEFWQSVDDAIPVGRAAESSDIASAILYLQSPLAAYVTGHILVLDGALQNAPACPMI